MSNARGQAIDKTHLSIDTAEERGFIHRDYLAHCLRWSHALKLLFKRGLYRRAVILDIGCGKEMPFAKLLYSNRMFPPRYIGIDVNKLDLPEMLNKESIIDKISIFEKTDFSKDVFLLDEKSIFVTGKDKKRLPRPNFVTCFEVIEHVEPLHAIDILKKVYKIMPSKTTFLLSTPNFNGKAAANHVNEMTFEVLKNVLLKIGFDIINVFGTFASQTEIYPVMHQEEALVYNALREYYDSNLLSIMLAPLHPRQSRNCLWELSKNNPEQNILRSVYMPYDEDLDTIISWDEIPKPWSSSEKANDFALI